MQEKGFTVSCLHGEIEQKECDLIMIECRSASSRKLTDLLFDVQFATGYASVIAINVSYNLPSNP